MPAVEALRKLQRLRSFTGDVPQFWPLYLDALLGLTSGTAGLICLQDQDGEWRTLAWTPQGPEFEPWLQRILSGMEDINQSCTSQGFAILPRPDHVLVSCPLILDLGRNTCLFVGSLEKSQEPDAWPVVQSLLTSNDLYAQYRIRRSVGETLTQKGQLTQVLDLSTQIDGCERFLAAAMTLCNELATRFRCERVNLGWIEGEYVQVKAMSHSDSFEKKMDVVRDLENALEEAWEQDCDLTWPTHEGCALVTRSHEIYARSRDCRHVATLLLRVAGEVVGVCSLERSARSFDETELRCLRVGLDQISRRLDDLHYHDRWFGAIWKDKVHQGLSKLVGFEHTWLKAGALAIVLLTAFSLLVPLPWRVDATAMVKTDRISYLTAPYEGYIDSACVKPGDLVVKGQPLLILDRKDLLLQEADLMAEAQNHLREVQKAQATEDLPGIRINGARLDQTTAKLNTTRWRLERSVLRCEFERAVVIEGNLEQKKGAPVRQGEELLKIARIENLHAELDVDESELHSVLASLKGEISLRSRPSETFPVAVERILPAAQTKEKDNVFVVRARFAGPVPDWFRPGMTGVARIEAGHRTLWWIVSHKTLDFLRLKFWW
ncbi:MAG: hypothetical protein RL318_752 [Fibrobacterota bacterium]|jgi:hypothetical protein